MRRLNWNRYLPCPRCSAPTGQPCINLRPHDGGGPKAKQHAVRLQIRPVLPPWHMRVLRLLAEGKTYRVIAAELGWHPDTVAACIKQLRARLGAYDRWHAVELAQAKGLLP